MSEHVSWYAFSRMSALRSALFHCSSAALLAPFHLWSFSDNARSTEGVILAVHGEELPIDWGERLRPNQIEVLQEVLLPSLRESTAQKSLRDKLAEQTFTVEFAKEQTGEAFTVEVKSLRWGAYLLGSLPLTPPMESAKVEWVLFDLPETLIKQSVSDHLALGNYELRCSPVKDGRQWLWAKNPEYFLVMKYQDEPGVRAYHSFPEQKNLFTPWGIHCLDSERIQLPKSDALFLLEESGEGAWLETGHWWLVSEMIEIEGIPTPQVLAEITRPPKIPIPIRYMPATPKEVPLLWLLRAEQLQSHVEPLFFELGVEDRSSLSVFVGEITTPEVNADTGEEEAKVEPFYVVRDNRIQRDSPLFSPQEVLGFEAFLPHDGLYLLRGTRMLPSLSPDGWRREFSLSPGHYTLLEPDPETGAIRDWRVPQNAFVLLDKLISYQLGTHKTDIQRMAQGMMFDILFEPMPILEPKKKTPRQTVKTKPIKSPKRVIPLHIRTPNPRAQGTTSGGEGSISMLEALRKRLAPILSSNKSLAADDWIEWASANFNEYCFEDKENYLLEAFKALDQVFNKDRSAEKAVELERHMLKHVLGLEGLDFLGQMERLDQIVQEYVSTNKAMTDKDIWQRFVYFARFAFRYRTRMLMESDKEQRSPEDRQILRRRFYRDLPAVEEILMIQEHFLYVSGGAQLLEDTELFEHARIRYRRSLKELSARPEELPDIAFKK